MRPRHQYRLLQAAFIFALIGVAFFGSYQGIRYSEKSEANQRAQRGGHDKKPAKFSWEWATHDPVAVGTFMLCFVTGILAIVTGGLYIATARLAKDSREASEKALAASTEATEAQKKSTSIAINTERPYVFISDIELVGGVSLPDGSTAYGVVLIFKNYGRSPAFVKRIGWGFKVFEYDAVPETPEYRFADGLTIEMVIGADKVERFPIDGPLLVIPKSVNQPGASQHPHVWGQIRYGDFMGGVGETGFIAFRYPELRAGPHLVQEAAFRFRGPPAYTYQRYREDGSDPS